MECGEKLNDAMMKFKTCIFGFEALSIKEFSFWGRDYFVFSQIHTM